VYKDERENLQIVDNAYDDVVITFISSLIDPSRNHGITIIKRLDTIFVLLKNHPIKTL